MLRAVLLALCALVARAQMGMDGLPKKPKPQPIDSDVKYI